MNYCNYLVFYMKLLNDLFCNIFESVLECCELTGVSLLWTAGGGGGGGGLG